MTDLAHEEAALERFARAFLRPTLFECVRELRGVTLGGWRVLSAYAIGGEGILLRVHRGAETGLLKLPHLPYDRPAQFGARAIRAGRRELVFEAAILERFAGHLLPARLDFATGENPLLAGRSLAQGERFVVMEFLAGRPLDLEIRARRACDADANDALTTWLNDLLGFLAVLKQRECYYTDFKPANLLVTPAGKLHLLDAGSITTAGSTRALPTTPGYGPWPLPVRPDPLELERCSLLALGRTLYASLLNRVLYRAVALDFDAFGAVWPARRRLVEDLTTGALCSIEAAQEALVGRAHGTRS